MSPRIASVVALIAACSWIQAACARPTEPTSSAPEPPTPKTATVFDFEQQAVGKLPGGFTAALTGGGGPIDWRVEKRARKPRPPA